MIQFAVLGLVLLGLSRVIESDEGRATIVVSADTLARLEAQQTRELGRAPTDAELDAALRAWADGETLDREARALGLDRGDPIIRRRLIQKMRFLLEDSASLDPELGPDLEPERSPSQEPDGDSPAVPGEATRERAMAELRARYEVVIEDRE